MHEDMRTLLNAFLDGELHDRRLLEMQTHLASCAICRKELSELRLVSNLLQVAPAPEYAHAGRFVSQLILSLPRRTLPDRPPMPGSPAWWLIPTGLLGAWFFVQTVFTLTDVVAAANMTGLMGHAVDWLGGGQESIWFSAITSLFGGQVVGAQPTLSLLNNVNVFGASLLGGFLWQALIVLLYWAWLFIWWLRRNPRPLKMPNMS